MAGVDKSAVLKDGTKISYVEEGTGSHTTLLMPGALGTARTDFTPQIDHLNSKGELKLIVWDPPGYGESRPPERTWPKSPNHFYSRDADVAMDFMSKIGEEKFSILGWSDGAITALLMAGRYPQNISKVIAHAGQSYYSETDMEKLMKVIDVSNWSARMREPMENMYGKENFPILWKEFIEACKEIYDNNGGDICKAFLPKIQCPTLIVHGDKDAMVSDEHPEYLEQHIQNSSVHRFPDGKHNLHFKYKDEFNQLVEEFLLNDGK